MKSIMKKLFSLLLVGVVAVSMFGFVAPMNVSAKGADSRGIIKFRDEAGYNVTFHYKMLDKNDNVISTGKTKKLKNLPRCRTAKIEIPSDTSTVEIKTYMHYNGGVWVGYKRSNTIKLKVDESNVSNNCELKVAAKGTIFGGDVKLSLPNNNSWYYSAY